MTYISRSVREAVQTLNVKAYELPYNEAEDLRVAVAEKYSQGHYDWLWEFYEDNVSIQSANGWKYLTEYLGNRRAILFFNKSDDKVMFSFERGADIVTVLEETPGFEFYVTDPIMSYLISFNHHDFLSALGTAKTWLANR